ncbi:5247_t:CDS:2, partial [Scutellospora calospora]
NLSNAQNAPPPRYGYFNMVPWSILDNHITGENCDSIWPRRQEKGNTTRAEQILCKRSGTLKILIKPCCFVFAHPCPTQKVRRTIESHKSMSQISKCEGQDKALCKNKLVVVDIFVNESNCYYLALSLLMGDSLEEVKLNHEKDKLF